MVRAPMSTPFHPTRRRFLASALPLGLVVPACALGTTPSKKKGLAGHDREAHLALKVSWWYNWGADGSPHDGVEYFPMIKGKGRMEENHFRQVAKHKERGIKELLGFNEPERGDQGNLSVEEALAAWPKLEATGLRLGSPIPSSDGKGTEWLKSFLEQANKKKLRVDFIGLHWYRSADPSAFETWLKEWNREFRKPIWLTEFNPWRGHTEREHFDFLRGALRFLERADFVERYAYFNPNDEGNLFAAEAAKAADKSGPRPLTKLGVLYRDIDQGRK